MASSLKEELAETTQYTTRWARRNYILAHAVFTISVLGSFAASVVAAGELGNKVFRAVLAALPGLMLLINNTLRFEERTKWFWRKNLIAERYQRQLRDDSNPNVTTLSAKYSDENEKLDADWPAFGTSPGQPTK